MDKTDKGDLLVDCIECGFYMTGGNFSGFNSIPKTGTKDFLSPRSRLTVYSWLPYKKGRVVYEIQRACYLDPDVVADIRNVQVLDKRKNRVAVSGLTCQAPPPITKLAIYTTGGFQIEYYLSADFRNCFEEVVADRADYTTLRVD
ncbi:hypothetical protein FVEG_17609 [Fusarium verticillioides 7600]|uniref:Acyclic terpene utilisation N-terminal domain-containing protein n=1 Tax=Gibberella moniliformis (strain M3125 / FGSC 7600) TaxID=334819 RepID=W7N821_GIBM7|nr:hypothetical protein FVEG_17609 [Fusarium verticillioides 7600]EWG55874.1 hypothetical protein FVEG_17609 [Fusarium verticillioides 7600]